MTIVNEEGGIHGRKIKSFVRDDQYNPAQTKAVVKELVEKQGFSPSSAGWARAPRAWPLRIIWFRTRSSGSVRPRPLRNTWNPTTPICSPSIPFLTTNPAS